MFDLRSSTKVERLSGVANLHVESEVGRAQNRFSRFPVSVTLKSVHAFFFSVLTYLLRAYNATNYTILYVEAGMRYNSPTAM